MTDDKTVERWGKEKLVKGEYEPDVTIRLGNRSVSVEGGVIRSVDIC